MTKWRQQESRLVRRFALFLIVANLIGAVAFYYAVPVYNAMKHINPGWMTREIRTALSLINVLGAILVYKRYFYIGLAVLIGTGSFAFMHTVPIRSAYAVSFLISYWDVIGLLVLRAIYRLQTKRTRRKPG